LTSFVARISSLLHALLTKTRRCDLLYHQLI
jgi:hypothetical protein